MMPGQSSAWETAHRTRPMRTVNGMMPVFGGQIAAFRKNSPSASGGSRIIATAYSRMFRIDSNMVKELMTRIWIIPSSR